MKFVASFINYRPVQINTGEHRVLVDTGTDGLGPNTGKLLQNLKTEGIDPEDIDTVILTHGHPDHIGGNIRDLDTKRLYPFVIDALNWMVESFSD